MLDVLHTSVFGFSLDSWLVGLVAGLITYFVLSKKSSDSKRSNLLSHLWSDPQSAAYLPLSEPTRKVIRGLVLNTPIFMMLNLGLSIIMEVTPWSSLLIGLYIFLAVLVSCLILEFLIAFIVLIEKFWEG